MLNITALLVSLLALAALPASAANLSAQRRNFFRPATCSTRRV